MIDACLGSAGSVYSALQRHICEALCGLSPHEKMDDGTAFFVREECSIVREAVVLTPASGVRTLGKRIRELGAHSKNRVRVASEAAALLAQCNLLYTTSRRHRLCIQAPCNRRS